MPGHESVETQSELEPQRVPGQDESDQAKERRLREEKAVDDNTVLSLLRRLRQAVIQAPRPSDSSAGGDEFIVRRLQVRTAGTPQRGPNIPVPRGYSVVVRQRRHAGSPTGYIAGSETAVSATDSRSELSDGDSINVKVSNLNKIWADANTNNISFELIVEV